MQHSKKDPFEELLRDHLARAGGATVTGPCPDENSMAAYVEDRLSAGPKAAFVAHLSTCDRCQSELALLVKTETPSSLHAEPRKNKWPFKNSFGLLLSWLPSGSLRPALAVLVAGLIVGWGGYQLLREPKQAIEVASQDQKRDSAQGSESLFQKDKSLGRSIQDQGKMGQPDFTNRAKESALGHSPAKSSADSPQDNRADQQGGSLKDTSFAEQDKQNAQSNEMASKSKVTRESPPIQVAQDALKSDSKELESELRQHGQKSENEIEARRSAENAAAPSSESAKSEPTYHPSSPPTSVMNRMAQVRSIKKGESKTAAAGRIDGDEKQVVASAESPVRTVEEVSARQREQSGGKQFELRDGIWQDLSIRPAEIKTALDLKVGTREYESYRTKFVAFQSILGRSEDVLIKLSGKIFRIRK